MSDNQQATTMDQWIIPRAGHRLVVAAVSLGVVAVAAGCAIFQDSPMSDEEQQAYRTALERLMQGHVYEMRCPALLPLAEELLWDQGYDGEQIEYQDAERGLATDWVDDGERRRIRHLIHARPVGFDECAIHITRHHEVGAGGDEERRDLVMELALLESIDEEEARRIRREARREVSERVEE